MGHLLEEHVSIVPMIGDCVRHLRDCIPIHQGDWIEQIVIREHQQRIATPQRKSL